MDLNEKLAAAMTLENLRSTDEIVKQHTTVAEEAVLGWEEADVEISSLKHQIDGLLEEKLAYQERVAGLQEALKDCKEQLRHAHEKQEERIHEAVVKKAREWEYTRSELEAKLVEADRQFYEMSAEKSSLIKSLENQARVMTELDDARMKTMTKNNALNMELNEVQQQFALLQEGMTSLKREVSLCIEERESLKKTVDLVNKEKFENGRKINKLEAEPQKLKAILKKKQAGNQMKLESKALGESGELKCGKTLNTRSPRLHSAESSTGSLKAMSACSYEASSQGSNKDTEFLQERLSTMENETKMLRAALAKQQRELQAAKTMCAKAASKLSLAENQLEVMSNRGPKKVRPLSTEGDLDLSRKSDSPTSISGSLVHNADADVWASALIAELENFKDDSPSHSNELVNPSSLELMADFDEMEQLACDKSAACDAGLNDNNAHNACTQKKVEMLAGHEHSHTTNAFLSPIASIKYSSPNELDSMSLISCICKIICILEKFGTQHGVMDFPGLDHEVQSVRLEDSALYSCVQKLVCARNCLLCGKTNALDFYAELVMLLDDTLTAKSTLEADCQQSRDNHSPKLDNLLNAKQMTMLTDSFSTISGAPSTLVTQQWQRHGMLSTDSCSDNGHSLPRLAEEVKLLKDYILQLEDNMDAISECVEQIKDEFKDMASFEMELGILKSEKNAVAYSFRKVNDVISQIKSEISTLACTDLMKLKDICNTVISKTQDELSGSDNSLQPKMFDCENAKAKSLQVLGMEHKSEENVTEFIQKSNPLELELKATNGKDGVLQAELEEKFVVHKDVRVRLANHQQEIHRQQNRSVLSFTRIGNAGLPKSEAELEKEQEIEAAARKLAACQRAMFAIGQELLALGIPLDSCKVSFEQAA